MDTLEAIRTRLSIRQYLARPVPQDLLQQVLTAAMYAPSACKMRRRSSIPALAVLFSLAIASACLAAGEFERQQPNLMTNPSAEEAAANGMPKGWGKYVGAGGVRLAVTTDEKHSGKSAAYLELDNWHTPQDAQDSPENRSVSGAMILAENDGYRVKGALTCMPGARYAFSFWYKGTVPAAKVIVTGWPSEKADHNQRITVPVDAKPLRPGDQWQQCAGSFRIPGEVERFVVLRSRRAA